MLTYTSFVFFLGALGHEPGLVCPCRARGPMDGRQLAELPSADTLEEAKDVGLLLLPELFEVFVGAHFITALRKRRAGP